MAKKPPEPTRQDLIDAIIDLHQSLRCFTKAVDEMTTELHWFNNNSKDLMDRPKEAVVA